MLAAVRMEETQETRWHPLGRIFETESYAQCPTPLVMGDRIRVYYAARGARNRSYVNWVDLGLDGFKVLDSKSRVLQHGPSGAFDSCGQIPSFARQFGATPSVDLWYSGWLAPAGDVPYHNATGMARSLDGGQTFSRFHEGPVLDRTAQEPFLAVTPCLADNHLWYVSGLRWEWIGGRFEPIYVIRHAVQNRYGRWERDGLDVIPQRHARECFSRPWVMKSEDGWRMWFSYRDAIDYRDGKNAYRIGYATSADGWKWERQPDPAIARADWDATMQAYPAVFESRGKTYMLYNGQHFGKFGFGIAEAR